MIFLMYILFVTYTWFQVRDGLYFHFGVPYSRTPDEDILNIKLFVFASMFYGFGVLGGILHG